MMRSFSGREGGYAFGAAVVLSALISQLRTALPGNLDLRVAADARRLVASDAEMLDGAAFRAALEMIDHVTAPAEAAPLRSLSQPIAARKHPPTTRATPRKRGRRPQ